MEEESSLPIHDKIYTLLERRTSKKLLVSEFFALVENIRINTKTLESIRTELFDAFLMESQVNKISKSLLLYVRYTRADSRELLKQLIDMGWVNRKNYMITILKKTTE